MSRTEFVRRLVILLPYLLVASVLVFAMTATYLRSAPLPWHWMEMVRAEIRGACEHPDAQWMTMALAALYFYGFGALRWLQARSQLGKFLVRTRLVLIMAFSGCALASYALNYGTATGSTDLLVLLMALAVGQGVALFLGSEEPTDRSTGEIKLNLLRLIAVLLALASLAHPAASQQFQYRGRTRWVGLWENPNLFGVLMAVGFILNLGLLIHTWMGQRHGGRGSNQQTPQSVPCSFAVWLLGSLATGTGLLFSYSRGAWLGAAMGACWLCWRVLCCATGPSAPLRPRLLLFRRCVPALALLTLALCVAAFWNLRHTEIPLLRRLFTVGNPNDFSWRNRVASWPGALEVMARQPLTGWGWNRPLSIYEYGNKPTWLSEGGAISLNDYLMIGMTLGVPALGTLLLWVWLAWHFPLANAPPQPSAVYHPCMFLSHSALIPLLLACALDGGLFKLAVAVPYWALLELAEDSTTATLALDKGRGAEGVSQRSG
jgi:O-antigen ligase